MKKIIIYGAGVCGRETYNIIKAINEDKQTWEVLGFVDDNPSIIGEKKDGLPVYSTQDKIKSKNVFGICSVVDPIKRKRIVENELLPSGFKLASIVHPEVNLPNDIKMMPGVIIYPGVKISFNVMLGRCACVFFNVVLGHDLLISDYVSILSAVIVNGGSKIGSCTSIGSGSVLHQSITVGQNSVIGMGTALIEDVGSNKSVMDLARKVVKDCQAGVQS